jgi:catechol-2,3-dioxygenase
MMRPPEVSFSHIGLFVIDMDRMVDFYTRTLGFFITDKGMLGERRLTFLSRDPREHHQIVLCTGRHPDLNVKVINQISFRMASLSALQRFWRTLSNEPVADLDPTIHGNAWALYFRDPEGNRIELFVDSEWYIAQPVRHPLDLSMPEADIRRITYEFCRDQPGFKPIEHWYAEMRELMSTRHVAE